MDSWKLIVPECSARVHGPHAAFLQGALITFIKPDIFIEESCAIAYLQTKIVNNENRGYNEKMMLIISHFFSMHLSSELIMTIDF